VCLVYGDAVRLNVLMGIAEPTNSEVLRSARFMAVLGLASRDVQRRGAMREWLKLVGVLLMLSSSACATVRTASGDATLEIPTAVSPRPDFASTRGALGDDMRDALAATVIIFHGDGAVGMGVLLDKKGWLVAPSSKVDVEPNPEHELEVTIKLGAIDSDGVVILGEERPALVYAVDEELGVALLRLMDPGDLVTSTLSLAERGPGPEQAIRCLAFTSKFFFDFGRGQVRNMGPSGDGGGLALDASCDLPERYPGALFTTEDYELLGIEVASGRIVPNTALREFVERRPDRPVRRTPAYMLPSMP
jgi:hypothetical protein